MIVPFVRIATTVLVTIAVLSWRIEAQPQVGVIAGFVRDSLGAGVSSAEVQTSTGTTVRTGSLGAFVLSNVPPGRVELVIRRLGFRRSTTTLNVIAAETASVRIVLARVPLRLEPVVATARSEAYDARLDGFHSRVGRKGGRFITREQIDRMSNTSLVDALRRLGNARVVTLRGNAGHTVMLGGANCAPTVFVDGFASTVSVFDLDIIDLLNVEGVEMYAGGLSAPPELLPLAGREACGVIAIWSRPFRPRVATSPKPLNVDSLLSSRQVLTEDEVDAPASFQSEGAALVYPEAEFKARVSGRVLLEFVVDAAGRVESGTIRVVTASDSAFARSASASVAGARFIPARLGGRSVRQLVQMPFEFDPDRRSPQQVRREM